MSLLRKSYIDLDWPAWMSSRFPFDRFDGWTDVSTEIGIRVEEFEKDGQFVIRAEVPGIDPDKDVELALSEGVLRLMVHRQKEDKASDSRHDRSEFHYGSFTRLVALDDRRTQLVEASTRSARRGTRRPRTSGHVVATSPQPSQLRRLGREFIASLARYGISRVPAGPVTTPGPNPAP